MGRDDEWYQKQQRNQIHVINKCKGYFMIHKEQKIRREPSELEEHARAMSRTMHLMNNPDFLFEYMNIL